MQISWVTNTIWIRKLTFQMYVAFCMFSFLAEPVFTNCSFMSGASRWKQVCNDCGPSHCTQHECKCHRIASPLARLLVTASDCVPRLQVVLSVEEITRDKKVLALKFRRRKNSRRRKGHRRDLTVLRVVDIVPSTEDLAALVPSK